MPYISPESLQQELLQLEIVQEDELPSLPKLERILEKLESRIDTWLGYHAPVSEYEEEYRTSNKGIVTLRQYPVLDVIKAWYYFGIDPVAPTRTDPMEISSWWIHDETFHTPYPDSVIRVRYTAGLDPLPRPFHLAIVDLAEKVLENKGSMDFLDDAYHAGVSSLGVPGINKSWQLGKVDNPAGGTNLDKYLGRYLETYRRKFVY